MIITGVAERVPERLAGLVCLDALVPANGEDSYDAEISSKMFAPPTGRRRGPLVCLASSSSRPTWTGSGR
jgi:hypothetical protein